MTQSSYRYSLQKPGASDELSRLHAAIGQVLNDAGFPKGVVNVLSNAPADAPKIIEALVAHPAVKRINFTGSTRVGKIIAKLAAEHLKPVLLELGGNWCEDCIILTNVMKLPTVAPFIDAHFEVVLVDVGRFNRNLQIPARFGFTHHLEGAPFVIVTDANGKVLNTGETTSLITSRAKTPQAMVDQLASWAS